MIKTKMIVLFALVCYLVPISTFSDEVVFDFGTWKNKNSTKKDITAVTRGGDLGVFRGKTEKEIESRFTCLGPLGVNTIMYDRTWGTFPGVRKSYSKSLSFKDELIYNYFSVVSVKPGSPAEGKIFVGDKIIAIDGELLEGGQKQYLDQILNNRDIRGLEMHAGKLIDKAEGKGQITLTVLRLKKDSVKLPNSIRKWEVYKTVKSSTDKQFTIPLPASGLVKIGSANCSFSNLHFADTKGNKIKFLPNKGNIEKTICDIPGENWILKGVVSSKKPECIFNVLIAKEPKSICKELKPYLHKVNLNIDAIGSFGKNYNSNSMKVRNYSAMLAHRLFLQQGPKGNWEGGGMADSGFQTAIVGLALMSTGNIQYNAAIRKAAYFVAHQAERHGWSYPRGVELTFLAEYYLRYKDAEMLPLLRYKMNVIRDYVYNDYTSGHSKANPGYGGGGYIGAGSVIACGLAVACQTPVANKKDKALLYNMMSRIEGLAPRGVTPYTRGALPSVSRLLRQSKKPISYQGTGCGTGGYIAAAIISGWKGTFYKNAIRRYSTAPYGTSDWGHATQTLQFFWGMLAAHYAGEKIFTETMNAYLWKFTTYREFDGFINGNNNIRHDLHSGDNAVGRYWRTASFLLLLNANKKNLAITGKLQGHEKKISSRMNAGTFARYKYILQNWILAQDQLGKLSPESLNTGITYLKNISDSQVATLTNYIKVNAQKIALDITKLTSSPKGTSNGQLAELVLGIAFSANCRYGYYKEFTKAKGPNKEKIRKALKKKAKLSKGPIDYFILINPHCFIQKNPNIFYGDIKNAEFKLSDIKVTSFLDGKKRSSTRDKKNGYELLFKMMRGGSKTLTLNISYRVGEIKINYSTKVLVEWVHAYTPFITQFHVKGMLENDFAQNYDIRLRLKTGEALDCEFSKNYNPPKFLEAGEYNLIVSPGSQWGIDIKSIKKRSPNNSRIVKFTTDKGSQLNDNNNKTGIDLSLGDSLEINLDKEETMCGISVESSAKRYAYIKFEGFVNDKWVLMTAFEQSAFQRCLPTKTKRIKITYFSASEKSKKRKYTIQEIKLIRAK